MRPLGVREEAPRRKRADLLLLTQNPLANVSAYDSIETIFLNGEPIAREALRWHD